MNPKIAHRGEQNGSFLKNLNSYKMISFWCFLSGLLNSAPVGGQMLDAW